MTVGITNEAGGVINVTANATAPGAATAVAHGIVVSNEATTTTAMVPTEAGSALVTTTNAHPLAGTINNSGTLNVVAHAAGGVASATFTTLTGTGESVTTTTVTTTTPLSSAVATGIRTNSGVNNLLISNSGAINVDAITENGGAATAYGIGVTSNGVATPGVDDVTTIENSGDIIVRVSTDGGTTFHRGTAIDVTEAPNRTVINLLSGSIFGNIELQSDDDTINVTGGETLFNGIINSGCLPADGVPATTAGGAADSPALSSCGVGTLNINNGGNFHLQIDPVDGPSYVFMDTLDMRAVAVDEDDPGAPGTITFDLPGAISGEAVVGTYPQVFVDNAFLDGTLVANFAPGTLFDDTVYQNVIDANVRTGTFDQCIISGIPANSLLLDFGCVYDNQNNVDLALTPHRSTRSLVSIRTASRWARASSASSTSALRAASRICWRTCS